MAAHAMRIDSAWRALTRMTMAFTRILRGVFAASATSLLLAASVAHSTGTRQPDGPTPPLSQAEAAFPDAPFGVDPMVTGPSSASLKTRQSGLGCSDAVWPDFPLACYPK